MINMRLISRAGGLNSEQIETLKFPQTGVEVLAYRGTQIELNFLASHGNVITF